MNDVALVGELQTRRGQQLREATLEALNHIIAPAVQSRFHKQFGQPPTALEDYSLWLTAVSPMDDRWKLDLMKTTDTLQRLELLAPMFMPVVPAMPSTGPNSETVDGPTAPTATASDEEDVVSQVRNGEGDNNNGDNDNDIGRDSEGDRQ